MKKQLEEIKWKTKKQGQYFKNKAPSHYFSN